MLELKETRTKRVKKKKMGCNKSISRIMRRFAAMMKIATFMMFFIFIYGLLESANTDLVQKENSQVPETKLLSRHERKDNSIDYDVTTKKTTRMTKQSKDKDFLDVAEDKQPLPVPSLQEAGHKTMQYGKIGTKEFQDSEIEDRLNWRRKIKLKSFAQTPPNPSLIFHNKLPKSGSSTINNILKTLSRKNHFNFLKVETTVSATMDDSSFIEDTMTKAKKPFLLLKHHRWLKFKRSEQPTFINVMRDPLEWFTSRYYFSRFGWERKPGCRKTDCGMTKEERVMDIDDCVKMRHHECMFPWNYIQFFCGNAVECYDSTKIEQKRRATNIAKNNILNEYYAVGILEQFEDTLRMFETMLPQYFDSAVTAWKSEFVQTKQNMTRTTYKREMSEESKKFFRDGPLHFEIELYNFARELFNERLKRLNIEPTT